MIKTLGPPMSFKVAWPGTRTDLPNNAPIIICTDSLAWDLGFHEGVARFQAMPKQC